MSGGDPNPGPGEPDDVDDLFRELAGLFLGDPDVTEGTGFGKSKGLRVGRKIFAIFGPAGLTVKLPKAQVDELVAAGWGTHFDPGHGRLMKEWVTLPAEHHELWPQLAAEALAYVRP